MFLFWFGLVLMCSVPLALTVYLTGAYFYLKRKNMPHLMRIFQEKPLFVIPRGQPVPEAEEVRFPTTNDLQLSGCYLKGRAPRRGVILFGLEFGSNRWSCTSYCQHLLESGYDVFACEPRNQGDSDALNGYDPLQWVTDYEVEDARAAIRYLKSRPDADPRGIGFFGISRGGGAGVLAAAADSYVRCCVADGMYATYVVLVRYMRRWYKIYNQNHMMQVALPLWYYGSVANAGLRQIERERHCRFPHLECAIRRLAPRPLLMIHGEQDTYIKADMARALFAQVREPKEFWLVPNAKHNQALHVAGDEYCRRVREFFDKHLAPSPAPDAVDGTGSDRPIAVV